MMIFLFLSKNGDSLAIAQRVVHEGHKVNFYINDVNKRGVGNGLLTKVNESGVLVDKSGVVDVGVLQRLLKPEPDCIIVDTVGSGFGNLAVELGKKFPMFGGNKWGNTLELDRAYGNKVMKMSGINIPENDEPIRGIKVSTELWFNGSDVLGINHTMEETYLMEGNIGPQVGCMGSVVWLGTKNSKLYKEGVGKIVPALKKVGFKGPISLNTIIVKDKLYGMGFTVGFKYNAIFILFEMYRGRINELLYGVASGVKVPMNFRANWGIGIDVLTLTLNGGVPIQGINKYNNKHLWFYDIQKENNEYSTLGIGGSICTITARGDEIGQYHPLRDAYRRAMRTISNLIIPDVIYRRDIGDRVYEEHKTLIKLGWL